MVKKSKKVKEEDKWVTGLSMGQPVFIDGLTHELFYLIVATKNEASKYQAVVIGMFGSDSFKVKMYGSFDDWGFNTGSLLDKFRGVDFLSRAKEEAGYERYWTDKKGVVKILQALSETQGVTVCPIEEVFKAYDVPYVTREQISRLLQPFIGGLRPALPFKAPELLEA